MQPARLELHWWSLTRSLTNQSTFQCCFNIPTHSKSHGRKYQLTTW